MSESEVREVYREAGLDEATRRRFLDWSQEAPSIAKAKLELSQGEDTLFARRR